MDLYEHWIKAKADEDAARQRRIALEEDIVAEHGCKDEGTATHHADGYKITITGKVNRTLDRAAWESVQGSIPENLRPVEYKPSLEVKGLRYLQQNEPDLYRIASEAITAKPGKAAVKVEKEEE